MGRVLIKEIKKQLKKFIGIYNSLYWIVQTVKKTNKPVAFLFKVSKWKKPYVKMLLYEYEVRFVAFYPNMKLLKYELSKFPQKVFIVWSVKEDFDVRDYAKKHKIPLYRLEDGFVRSIGLGAMHTPPYSLCLDKRGIYFDATKESDLEHIYNTFDFKSHPEYYSRAKNSIEKLKSLGLSKYNHVKTQDIQNIYGEKTRKRILVIGQVEDDASIKRGCFTAWTNNDLVRLAAKENPQAEIIYKPHPDVLSGRRKMQSNPDEVKTISKVITEPLSLADAFQTIDRVYTITSLSGFEALLRGIPVTTVGSPFYSGWGLTDDRQHIDRRKRKLTLEELFIGAYILYPRYIDPHTGEQLTLEETIQRISQRMKETI